MEKMIIVTTSIFTAIILTAILVLPHVLPAAAKNIIASSSSSQVNKAKAVNKIEAIAPVLPVKTSTSTENKVEIAKPVVKTVVKTVPIVKPVVKTVPTVKPAVKTVPIVKAATGAIIGKYGTTMKWDAKATKLISNFQAYDYNTAIRSAYIKKVENYARRNGYSVITYAVVDSMRE